MVEEQWYTNKDLFEMINGLKADLAETRQAVQKYNNLQRTLSDCAERITKIEEQAAGKRSVGQGILQWTPWVIAVVSTMYAISGWLKIILP